MARGEDIFWAEHLGIEAEDWDTPGICYRPHVGLNGYRGFWCFRRNDRVVVSAPPRWVERLRTLFAGWDQDTLMNRASLAAALAGDCAGGLCVLTHPDFRGGGRGSSVTSAVVANALANGKLVLYQTLESNQAAVRIALRLGYRRYGNHIAVRLKRDAPEA